MNFLNAYVGSIINPEMDDINNELIKTIKDSANSGKISV